MSAICGIVGAGAAGQKGTRDLAIGGNDVIKALGVPPGPIIGRVLERLLERVLDDPQLNERDALLSLVPQCAAEARS